jgi:hypothetical protein
MIVDFINTDEEFLNDLREYFSSYGTLYACKYCHETNFDYILVEFADFGNRKKQRIKRKTEFFFLDQVDRIILDKPHYINKHELHVMKCIQSNKILMNIKYSSNENNSIAKDAIDVDDDQKFLKYELNYKKDLTKKLNDNISEIDLENEVYRLQNILKKLTEDFTIKRKQLEDDCCEQLRKLNENADQTHRLQQDLEQG